MALLKQVTNEYGITTSYHRISRASLRDGGLICNLESYVSKDYRELDRNADSQTFMFDITLQEEESMGIRQLCYTKIKELEAWADAEDC